MATDYFFRTYAATDAPFYAYRIEGDYVVKLEVTPNVTAGGLSRVVEIERWKADSFMIADIEGRIKDAFKVANRNT